MIVHSPFITRVIDDDAEVKRLAKRLGAWRKIRISIKDGESGVAIAGDWLIGYYDDGFIAYQIPDPLARAAALGDMMKPLRRNGAA